MKITIKDCLQLEVFKNSVVLAGDKKLENRVRTISVLDETDLEIGIKNNGVKEQLVLTHFWQCVDDIDLQCEFVKGLAKTSVAALVIFCTNDGVKSVNNKVTELAEKLNFPLVSLLTNSEITYSKVLEQIQDKILYGDNFKNSLINNTIYHLLNFEKHSSFIIKLFFNTQKIIASKPRHRVKEVEQKYYDVFKETLQKGIATGEIREDLEYERFMQIMFIIMHSMLFMYLPEDIQPINAEERVTNYELMLDIMIEGIRRK
jgi:hypothetical protein